MILQPGVHLGVPDAIYHADPCPEPSLSSGIMQRLLTASAWHARYHHPKLNPAGVVDEPNDQTDRGQLAHRMLFGGLEAVVSVDPKDFPAEKTGNIPDGWTNKAIKAERDRIRLLGKIPVFKDVYEQAHTMRDVAIAKLDRCGIDLEDGNCEVTLVWREGDVWCRGRTDWWHRDRERLMLEYKSTASLAEPDSWSRRMIGPMGYGIQQAHYRRGSLKLELGRPHWVWLVQENFPPYECSLVGVSTGRDEIYEKQRAHAVQLWRQALTSGRWPGYSDEVYLSEPTTFEMMEHEMLSLDERLELGGQG